MLVPVASAQREWQNTLRRAQAFFSWFVINSDSQVVWISHWNKGIPRHSLILLIFKSNYCMTARDLFSDLSVLSKPSTSRRVEEPFTGLGGYQASEGSPCGSPPVSGRLQSCPLQENVTIRPLCRPGEWLQVLVRSTQTSEARQLCDPPFNAAVFFINGVTNVRVKS